MADLTARLAAASQEGHVVIAGDSNSHVSILLESASAEVRGCTNAQSQYMGADSQAFAGTPAPSFALVTPRVMSMPFTLKSQL